MLVVLCRGGLDLARKQVFLYVFRTGMLQPVEVHVEIVRFAT